jgi:hypothetical protein
MDRVRLGVDGHRRDPVGQATPNGAQVTPPSTLFTTP